MESMVLAIRVRKNSGGQRKWKPYRDDQGHFFQLDKAPWSTLSGYSQCERGMGLKKKMRRNDFFFFLQTIGNNRRGRYLALRLEFKKWSSRWGIRRKDNKKDMRKENNQGNLEALSWWWTLLAGWMFQRNYHFVHHHLTGGLLGIIHRAQHHILAEQVFRNILE